MLQQFCFHSLSEFSLLTVMKIIAGLVEYRLGESLVTYYNQPLIAGLLSFVARTLNSYWGTQVGLFPVSFVLCGVCFSSSFKFFIVNNHDF